MCSKKLPATLLRAVIRMRQTLAALGILQHIIHEWDDEPAPKILSNCRQALQNRKHGKLLVVDSVIPENGGTHRTGIPRAVGQRWIRDHAHCSDAHSGQRNRGPLEVNNCALSACTTLSYRLAASCLNLRLENASHFLLLGTAQTVIYHPSSVEP
jgi:hypothetical protein